ncbi:hypothetical protein [Ramlibacter sp. 2FC]|uniref:hypothetical protein n=1 Tax=Ramlibacter sp. 2FC TaxID=2502188 RepID=UPI0010F9C7A1|nr:hypothetical protein [Ramlibacter sp. 2FC]
MRTPREGEQLTAVDGQSWRVASVFQDVEGEADEAYDPDFFLVTLVPVQAGAGAAGMELDNAQFEAFCETHGIAL